jgi:adenine-specific DNA-methyltransferase
LELEKLIGSGLMDFPKNTDVMKEFVQLVTDADSLVLDFFAGSCTTAQAVLELNREDGGNRRFIMVQLPEPTDNKKYPTIAEIGKERIRRVIATLKEADKDKLPLETPAAPGSPTPEDLGFKVFKLAASNYLPWVGVEERTPEAYLRQMGMFTDPLVPHWKPVNVLWEVALKEGYGLGARIEKLDAGQGNTVYRVTDPDKDQSFRLCLDDEIKPGLTAALKLGADDLFICRDRALDDTAAANLALQCRLKTI